MRKTPEECSKVQNAIQIIEKVLGEGIKSVKEGMTELDLTAEFEYLMRKFGAEGPSFSTTVLSGDKSSLPHESPDRKIINKGDFLLIDMGVIIDGYCSDITRTFLVGEETAKQREIYETVLQSTRAGVNTVKSGYSKHWDQWNLELQQCLLNDEGFGAKIAFIERGIDS